MFAEDCEFSGVDARQAADVFERLGFFGEKHRRGVIVFHESGRVLRAIDTETGPFSAPDAFRPEDLVELRSRSGADYAAAIEPAAFRRAFAEAQSRVNFQEPFFAQLLAFREGFGDEWGRAIRIEPDPFAWLADARLQKLRRAARYLPKSFSLALFVFEGPGPAIWLSLLLEIKRGEIVSISTSDLLEPLEMEPGLEGVRRSAHLLKKIRRKRGAAPTVGAFLEKPAFLSLAESKRPVRTLLNLTKSREAILKPIPASWSAALRIAGIWM